MHTPSAYSCHHTFICSLFFFFFVFCYFILNNSKHILMHWDHIHGSTGVHLVSHAWFLGYCRLVPHMVESQSDSRCPNLCHFSWCFYILRLPLWLSSPRHLSLPNAHKDEITVSSFSVCLWNYAANGLSDPALSHKTLFGQYIWRCGEIRAYYLENFESAIGHGSFKTSSLNYLSHRIFLKNWNNCPAVIVPCCIYMYCIQTRPTRLLLLTLTLKCWDGSWNLSPTVI